MANVGQIYYNVLDAVLLLPQARTGNYISNISAEAFYGTGNTPETAQIVTAYNGASAFSKVGIQAPPGTQVVLGTDSPINHKSIMIGRTGVYELDDDIVITYMAFVRPKTYIRDNEASDLAKLVGINGGTYNGVKITGMRKAELERAESLAGLKYPIPLTEFDEPVPPLWIETADEKYKDDVKTYYEEYKKIQDTYINAYDLSVNVYQQGVNGVFKVDTNPDHAQDLYNVIVDFVYE